MNMDDSFRSEIRRELIEKGTRCPNNNLIQVRSKPILIGQAILYCNTVRVRYANMSSRGGLGACSPRNFF